MVVPGRAAQGALPAGELAFSAGVTAQTASSHLARLLDGGLISVEKQGRHRYFRLAGAHVARALEHLFRPFVGSSRRGGTGLGLAIARELAQGHGGDLALVETGAGGSVFELTLPGVPPQAAKPGRRKPAADAADA